MIIDSPGGFELVEFAPGLRSIKKFKGYYFSNWVRDGLELGKEGSNIQTSYYRFATGQIVKVEDTQPEPYVAESTRSHQLDSGFYAVQDGGSSNEREFRISSYRPSKSGLEADGSLVELDGGMAIEARIWMPPESALHRWLSKVGIDSLKPKFQIDVSLWNLKRKDKQVLFTRVLSDHPVPVLKSVPGHRGAFLALGDRHYLLTID
jgi:hypothetical protein